MATVKGANRTKADDPKATNLLGKGLFRGNVRSMYDSYEAVTIAIGTIIEMGGDLPKGAKILEVILITDALGAGVTLAVGDAESTARYISATTCNTANLVTRSNVIDGRGYEVDMTTASTPDNQVLITTAGAIASGTIKLIILYTED